MQIRVWIRNEQEQVQELFVEPLQVIGDFAIYCDTSDNSVFNITHVPTGLALLTRIKSRKAGSTYLQILAGNNSFTEGLCLIVAMRGDLGQDPSGK